MNQMNPISLVSQIVYLYQIYIHSFRNFIYKIKSIIVHISELWFINSSIDYIKILNLGTIYI